LNQEVRRELQEVGLLEKEDRSIRVLTPRSDMTGADRAWAARYEPGDVLHYIRGSKDNGIEAGTEVQPELINGRFAYVSVSRASHEAQIYTNDAANLAERLSRDVSKSSAINFGIGQERVPNLDLGQSSTAKSVPATGLGLAI
jgi:hypothetical protein